jgi:O-acetyl-ADP-ribose deacetylase (regulator of RNase III)
MAISFSDHKNHATLSVGGTHIILDKDSHFTSSHSDFLVNPAQPKLTGGGGLDKVVHDAAGPALKAACKHIPKKNGIRCPTGEARLTHAGNLPQAYVLHTVGPKISGKVTKADKKKLWDCYHNCL